MENCMDVPQKTINRATIWSSNPIPGHVSWLNYTQGETYIPMFTAALFIIGKTWKQPREGNGNPFQCSCLENPMDRGAWWAALHRVAQSWTRLKRLSMRACIGEGNGNPLHYSCLENPRDRGAWWAAVYGVTQCQTQLKRLSSSSRKEPKCLSTDEWIKKME